VPTPGRWVGSPKGRKGLFLHRIASNNDDLTESDLLRDGGEPGVTPERIPEVKCKRLRCEPRIVCIRSTLEPDNRPFLVAKGQAHFCNRRRRSRGGGRPFEPREEHLRTLFLSRRGVCSAERAKHEG